MIGAVAGCVALFQPSNVSQIQETSLSGNRPEQTAISASPEALQKSFRPSGGPPPALQKSAETLMADYSTISLRWRFNDIVADTLMRSFGVIMIDIILDHVT